MTEPRYRLPNEVANQLQISPSTLRRWSNEFADYLSEAAGRPQPEPGSKKAHRRYTDEDLETLMTIKSLLAEGQTYIQVGKRLETLQTRRPAVEGVVEDEAGEIRALGPSLQDSPFAPAAAVLADTLHTVADGQQLLLGSQQANRELLTVVLQDNFGLKEENAKLRDRMLELERDIAEMRRQDANRREELDARLRQLEEQSVAQAPQPRAQPQPHPRPQPQPQPRPQSKKRSGCLGQFFG